MKQRKHIVITGTGRSGTTFLMQLLTRLGLDTGFRPEEISSHIEPVSNAGLEKDIRQDDCPGIVKSPWFCDHAKEVFARDDIEIEHILIPVRELTAAAESRRQVVKSNLGSCPWWKRFLLKSKLPGFEGGLWHTRSLAAGKQEKVLLHQQYKLLFAVANTDIPVTLLHYPRLVRDCAYLFDKLGPVLEGISYETFAAVFQEVVRPEIVHQFSPDDQVFSSGASP